MLYTSVCITYKCYNGRADNTYKYNAWPRNVAVEATIKKPKSKRKQWSLELPPTTWHGLRPIESLISALQCQLELG